MTRKAILLLFCLLFLVACSSQVNANQASSPTTITLDNSTNISTPTPASSTTKTGQPTVTPTTSSQLVPTATPTKKSTAKPKPTATPTNTPEPTGHSCTIASCPNPWGYHLQNGSGFPLVSAAPSGFCSYFVCMPDFLNEGGYIVECSNGEFSWKGAANSAGCEPGTIMGWLAP